MTETGLYVIESSEMDGERNGDQRGTRLHRTIVYIEKFRVEITIVFKSKDVTD